MRLHPRLAGTVATAAILVLAVAAQASAPAPVRATRANEMLPAAGYDESGSEVLTWSRSRPGAPWTYDAYLQRHGDPPVKLNTRGVAWSGDLDVARHLAVYQQARGNDSKIIFFDWADTTRTAAPAAVNTPAWEFAPRIQGHYLLFGRETWQTRPHVYALMLYNLDDGTLTTLAVIHHGYNYGAVIPGQVNGDWVVWQKATDYWSDLRVYRFNLVTGVKEQVPVSAGRFDYGPSVTADGTVYFVRSRSGCGRNVRIRSFSGGESTALVYAPPAGTAADSTYAEVRPDGSTQLLFIQLACTMPRANWNIYRLPVEDVAPPAPVSVHGASVGPPAAFAPSASQLHH
jgi:hypothetical protein